MRPPNGKLTNLQTDDPHDLFVAEATARVVAELVGVSRDAGGCPRPRGLL